MKHALFHRNHRSFKTKKWHLPRRLLLWIVPAPALGSLEKLSWSSLTRTFGENCRCLGQGQLPESWGFCLGEALFTSWVLRCSWGQRQSSENKWAWFLLSIFMAQNVWIFQDNFASHAAVCSYIYNPMLFYSSLRICAPFPYSPTSLYSLYSSCYVWQPTHSTP